MGEKFFTNQNQQKLLVELNNEMCTADEVCFVFPFISKAIINKIEASIKHCWMQKISIRIITTTFDDLAEYNNLLELTRLVTTYDNIQVKVEDNLEKRSERIHIKASLFKRFHGISTVILGSSNLTYKGMVTGREWNIKLTIKNNPNLVTEIIDEFEHLWNEVLVDFNDEIARNHLLERISQNQSMRIATMFNHTATEILTIRKYLYDFQKAIVAKLQYRRLCSKQAHLVIMATGTGKTVVAAFDYLHQLQENNHQPLKLLFLAHQKEILDQALQTFRNVLMDQTFEK
ncbi:DEAD/DEAH box helicase family protein [Spiroplasma endosymbiont of Seladonia tumulorum]|uniref:DEAD/DEAH box helicase family protein n=2 Tax=unclassified Spiroplasma TaxID=2637901 RepID=UPI0030D1C1C0